MQGESLVWLSAGTGLGLFVAMVMLAVFAAGERRRLRRRQKSPAATALSAAAPPEAPASASDPVRMEADRVAPAPEREVGQSPAPVAAAERPQPDIEGLFERAFQTSLRPEPEADDPPKRKDA